MTQKHPIDPAWFQEQLRKKGKTNAALAKLLGVDRSAVTNMWKGRRRMKVEEQDKIAQFLGVSLQEIVAHWGEKSVGFAENKQSDYVAEKVASQDVKVERQPKKDPYRHPAFGCMIGTLTVAPGVDLTEPMDFEWGGELYNE